MHLKLISSEELRHGINAFTLTCRENKTMDASKSDLLDLTYDKVQKAFRVSFF